jgi:glucosylceramidase
MTDPLPNTGRMRSYTLLAALLPLMLGACSSNGTGGVMPPEPPPAPGTGPAVEAWVTTGDKTRLLARETRLAFGATAPLALNIEVDATQRYQTMVGFGASITDASAWLIRNRLSASAQAALMAELFGRGPGGIGFEMTRLTIGASDFSRHHYSFDDRPAGQTDLELAHFSIEPSRADVLPLVKQALAINPALKVMASPWSAPGWMKSSDSLIKGSLRPDRYDVFSRYLLRYVDAYAAEGVPIFALTVQNEPHFEPGDYPGMRVDSAARAVLVGQHLGPLLASKGKNVQIIEWDHNWDEPQAPLTVLADAQARRYVAGVGWHCYVSESLLPNQSVVHDAYPDKDVWLTECSGGEWKPVWSERLPWTVRNLVIGATRHWARGVQMWNLALDEKFGPHLGGCNDCRGIVTIHSVSGAITRNLEYYAFAHASKFMRPGAQRIGSSTALDGLDNVAFRNADDGSIALVVCNSAAAARRFSVRQGGQVFTYTLPRESVATFTWQPAH